MSSEDRAQTLAAIRAARHNIGLISAWAGNKSLPQLRDDLML
jgi:hypothetical protein